jgi:hypothetical protein
MNRFLIVGGLLLSGAIMAPVAARAEDRDRHEIRYYDRDGRDYHAWNGDEDRAYRVYLQENHRNYREFRRVKYYQRRQYFRWRHEHPNHVLFRVEVR